MKLFVFGWATASTLQGQYVAPRAETVVAANAAIGAATAGLHAWIRGHPILPAVAKGLVGGSVHVGGKFLARRDAVLGMLTSSIGSSAVGNAGLGRPMFDIITIPLGPATIRFSPNATSSPRLSLNAYEAAVLSAMVVRSDVQLDTKRSARTGTFVFRTRSTFLLVGGDTVEATTYGNVPVLSAFALDPGRTWRHENAHLQQYYLLRETMGIPIERALRRRWDPRNRLPQWLELGVIVPLAWALEDAVTRRDGPLRRLVEAEAELLERRR